MSSPEKTSMSDEELEAFNAEAAAHAEEKARIKAELDAATKVELAKIEEMKAEAKAKNQAALDKAKSASNIFGGRIP